MFYRFFSTSCALFVLACIALLPDSATAYVGPGAGFAFVGSTFVFILTVLLAIASLALWPIQLLWRAASRKGIPKAAKTRRVVILGLDGLEPSLVECYMAEGKMPNLQKLQRAGSFHRLGTTLPALSPVAWSSFQTGVNPGAHNIFDFITRDKRYCLPLLSSTETDPPRSVKIFGKFRIPLGRRKVRLLRKSQPFWKILGRRGIFANILRVPISYPPEPCFGNVLSAMCTPDLRGSQGTFTVYTTGTVDSATTGGEVYQVERQERPEGVVVAGSLIGPPDPRRTDGKPLLAPFSLRIMPDGEEALLHLGKDRELLKRNVFSRWFKVEFRYGMRGRISGICRFCLREISPEIFLYVSPININPAEPALPISSPRYFSTYLAKQQGFYGTLGLMEDTWGRNEHALDDQRFLDQTYLTHDERERMFLATLDRTREGLCVGVFDASDRIQHMFWRYLDPQHPSPREEGNGFENVIPEMYERMDRLVGTVQARVRSADVLLVMSDHGFTSFRRCVNLNAWLQREGYLTVRDGASGDEYLQDVDWGRTRAFAVGLAGIYLNRIGREPFGTVADTEVEALKRELSEKLLALRDPVDSARPIRTVYDTAQSYRGLYAEEAPDLILGFEPGYRVSWESVKGAVESEIFSDNIKAWSGDHHVDPEAVPGILFSNRRIEREHPTILDIAPSVLDLFAVPVPAYMEGRALF